MAWHHLLNHQFCDLLITHITHNKEPWFLLQYHISYNAVEVQGAKLHKEEKEGVNLAIEEETEKERIRERKEGDSWERMTEEKNSMNEIACVLVQHFRVL